MAGKKAPHPAPILIGNCKVEINGYGIDCETSGNELQISLRDDSRISISVDNSKERMIREANCSRLPSYNPQDGDHEDLLITIVHPKDGDSESASLLQGALKVYVKELPAMKYAANTGKKSQFLERCLWSGKYWTLILRSNSIEGPGEVIAALSYQLVSADTRYAEIPLAAVESNWKNKGIGRLLYQELRRRLQNIGVTTILCWGDQESEAFWHKQGFISIGEVNSKGKAQKLPVKAKIRKALCFPGGSTLMIANLKDISSVDNQEHVQLCFSTSHVHLAGSCPVFKPGLAKSWMVTAPIGAEQNPLECCKSLVAVDSEESDGGCENTTQGMRFIRCDGGIVHSSSLRLGTKRPSWETSLSSLKSKRVRSSQFSDRCQDCSCEGNDTAYLNDRQSRGHPRILLMDIADGSKKAWLTKMVEQLGGSTTSDGSDCTHVVTSKARRTLNFCKALSFGAWIVSSDWLKASFREQKFLGESPFILQDEDYLLRYKCELRDAILRGKSRPRMLLSGYQICISKHIQPSVDTLSSIVKYSGGEVLRKLERTIRDPSRTIFLACEEDMAGALDASRGGAWTFGGDWLMSCVMKQELDLDALQFAESL